MNRSRQAHLRLAIFVAGLLAIFPLSEDGANAEAVCGRALGCARKAKTLIDALDKPSGEGADSIRFGLALHLGPVMYGNIGGGNRLDFTCIGPAVNLAARLEKIAGRINRTIVASADFAGICKGGWIDLGEFPIAGFARAERIYGLPDEAPAA